MIWYQLCFLDIRTCEATGPRPQIHREDFDTRYPLNVNDVDLESDNPPTEDAPHWTDMTFSRMRFEINEMHRYTWMERPRLERKKTTLTAVLTKVQHFIAATDKKYLPMLDKNQPLHNMALLVYKLTTLRIHVMFLHRYSSNHARKMPERLRKIVLTSGVQQVECAIMIETIPSLKPWSWYIGMSYSFPFASFSSNILQVPCISITPPSFCWLSCMQLMFGIMKTGSGSASIMFLSCPIISRVVRRPEWCCVRWFRRPKSITA
jgi:hypothetical protein